MTNDDLIFEFLGWEFTNCVTTIPGELCGSSMPCPIHRNHLDFKQDWKLLMFLIAKIERTSYEGKTFQVIIGKGACCTVYDKEGVISISEPGKDKLEATYNTLVDFLRWYKPYKKDPYYTVRELIAELRALPNQNKIVSVVVEDDKGSNTVDTTCFELHSTDSKEALKIFVSKEMKT